MLLYLGRTDTSSKLLDEKVPQMTSNISRQFTAKVSFAELCHDLTKMFLLTS